MKLRKIRWSRFLYRKTILILTNSNLHLSSLFKDGTRDEIQNDTDAGHLDLLSQNDLHLSFEMRA